LLTAPAIHVEGLTKDQAYTLDVRLLNSTCPFEVQPNGDIPDKLNWKLDIYSDKEAEWSKDAARDVFYQATLNAWNGEDKSRADKARAVLQRREEEFTFQNLRHDADPLRNYTQTLPEVTKAVPDLEGGEPFVLQPAVRQMTHHGLVAIQTVVTSREASSRKAQVTHSLEQWQACRESQTVLRAESHNTCRSVSQHNINTFLHWRDSVEAKVSRGISKRSAHFTTAVHEH